MTVSITLTVEEFQFASSIGAKRQSESEKRNLRNKYGFRGKDGLAIHIIGASGELATAKALGLVWPASVNTFKKISDLTSGLEIRTRTKETYDLIVRPDDADDRKYILVHQKSDYDYNIIGWILGKDAKNPNWSQKYGGRPAAYFVPKESLKDLSLLCLVG